MRRLLLPLLLVLLAAAQPAAAGSVCTAADVMACGASCWHCQGTTCTLASLLTVTPPIPGQACTFDFGTRDLVLVAGGFTAAANAFEIKAHGLTVGTGGTLEATGKQVTPGGVIRLTLGAGGFTVLAGANLIDLTGRADIANPVAGGGTFDVFSDGNVTLDGPGIAVDGTTFNSQGGIIDLNAGRKSGTTVVASGNITVRAVLSATGRANGFGGTVLLTANGDSGSGKVDVEQTIDVTGGLGGGTVCEVSSGDTILGTTAAGQPLLVADANGNAGFGGVIDVTAGGHVGGNNGATGVLSAQGSTASTAGIDGGSGGMVCIDGAAGLTLGGGINGGINATAGRSGCGGCIALATDTSGADLTVAVPMFAGAAGIDGFAGEIDVAASGSAILQGDMDASANNGCGTLCLMALADITLETPAQAIRADGLGGLILMCTGRDVVLGSPLVSAAATSTLTGNSGGSFCVLNNRNTMANGPVDVSAAGPNAGGMIDIEADRNFAIGSSAALGADGGRTGSGGSIFLLAGGPGFPGDLSLNGSAHATGSAPASALSQAAATLTGCTVHVGPTGLLDTLGDARASNTLKARTGLQTDAGALIATTGGSPTSRNFVTLPMGAPTPSAPAFSPPLAPGDVQFQPVCSPANPPPGCLLPCPVCGNGQVEYPETCDNGTANGACQPCDLNCRIHTCDDGNPCTVDGCDALLGCTHATIPGCTTTTTTSTTSTTTTAPPTTTTGSSTTTTSTTTIVQTTSTTGAPSTTTSVPSTTTTSTSSTAATSSTTSTTAPPECTAGTPGACDDHDLCTRDSCVAGRCVHTRLTGLDAVLCRLDDLTALMQAAPATALGGSLSRQRLETGVTRARAFTVAGQAARGRRRAVDVVKARRKLTAFIHAVRMGIHRKKVDADLGARLLSLAGAAMADLAPLRTGP